jgi:hypothetical protein
LKDHGLSAGAAGKKLFLYFGRGGWLILKRLLSPAAYFFAFLTHLFTGSISLTPDNTRTYDNINNFCNSSIFVEYLLIVWYNTARTGPAAG